MATFIGYNTINQFKNYTLTDFELIKRDLLNTLSIKKGEVPGRPNVGTKVFALMFEPQSVETTTLLENEIQEAVAQDPRIALTSLQIYPQENGILAQVSIRTVASSTAESLQIFFDEQTRSATYV